MKKIIYDREELATMKQVDNGEYTSVKNLEEEKNSLIGAAKFYNERKKSITLRLAHSDILKIKSMAKEEGIPYQTLIAAFLHKIANGRIELNLKTK